MNPAISAAIEAVNSKNEPVIYCSTVNSASIFRTSLIIVISDSHIYIFNLNGKIKQTLSFYEMTGMTIDGSTITFKFENSNYSIYTTEHEEIFKNVDDIVSHIFTMKEQHKLNITNFRVEQHKNNGISALFRLKAIYKNPNLENFKLMETILVCSQPCVSTNQFEDKVNFLPHFMTILPLCPYIKSVVFTKIDGIDNYQYLASLCSNELYLKHMLIYGDATPKFNEFIGNLQINKNQHLFGLGFADSNLTSDKLTLLSNFIKVGGLKSIEFHNAIGNDNMISFYNTFLTSGIFDTIFMMNFSGTKNLNLSLLFPKIKAVKVLCLSNCDLEIFDVITRVSELPDLKVLDISKNRCTSKVDPNVPITFPEFLNTINVNNTDFSPDCAVPFIKFIFNHFEYGLNLSIASIAPPESLEWNSILSCIGHLTYRSLVSLTWDNNLIHPKLFSFLLKNPYLKNLSLNSCVSRESATDAVASVALFVQSSKSLVNLSLRGDRTNYIGNNLEVLFNYVTDSQTLETLDLTYSKCGDAGFNQVNAFLTKSTSLKVLVIDGMRPKTVEPILNLAKLSHKVRDQIKVSYPYNDIEKLVSDGVISRKGQSELKRYFEISENNDSYFLKPFRVFRYFLFDEFPNDLQDEEVSRVYENRQLLDEVPPPLPQDERKSQSNTRTEILDFDNSSKRSNIRTTFNRSYAMTPSAQANPNYWSRNADFSKTLPINALSAPVSPVGGANSFRNDFFRRTEIYDEPIRRVRSPNNNRNASQRMLHTTINVFKEKEEMAPRKKQTSSSQRARSANLSPKVETKQQSHRPRRRKNVVDEENNDADENQNTSKRRVVTQKARTPQSQRRVIHRREEIEETIVEETRRVVKHHSQRNTPTSQRSKRPQNASDDDEREEFSKTSPVRRRGENTQGRSRTPTGRTEKRRREVISDEEEIIESPKRKAATPKRNKFETRTSNRTNSASTTPKIRKRRTQRNLNEDESEDENQVQRRTPKKSTRKRTQNNA